MAPGIAVANNPRGEMQVFAVDRADGSLWCIQQQSTNSPGWTAWTNLGGALRAPVRWAK